MLTVRWRALFAVLKDAWPMWLAVGGVAVAFAAGSILSWFLSPTLSAAIRYTGTMLQLFGLVTVAIGLSQMRQLFGRPSLSARIVGWFGRLAAAFTAPKPISAEASAGGYAIAGAEARLLRRSGPGAPVEQRLSVLEENVNHLRDELDTKVEGLRRELTAVKESIEHEKQQRQVEDEKTARKIEEVAVGGLHLESVGLFWLILGVVGTSIHDEIAVWLSLAA